MELNKSIGSLTPKLDASIIFKLHTARTKWETKTSCVADMVFLPASLYNEWMVYCKNCDIYSDFVYNSPHLFFGMVVHKYDGDRIVLAC